jgi:hypothetical protein
VASFQSTAINMLELLEEAKPFIVEPRNLRHLLKWWHFLAFKKSLGFKVSLLKCLLDIYAIGLKYF